jgi:uncharacterized protein (DUF1800 family)
MAQVNPEIDHLLRRAGFGVSAAEADIFKNMSTTAAIDYLVDYEGRPDDVDQRIGRPDHAQVGRGEDHVFSPDIDIEDARLRWMFRMVHSRRPLQEKMALFWHNHFATGYSKLNVDSGTVQGAKMLAMKPGVLRGPQGQIELFRQYALGNFRNLLLEIAKDPAMVIYLDGKSNTKAKPQENFGREIIELFTIGVDNYVETDVYAAARVFTGWNLRGSEDYRKDEYGDLNSYQEFAYNADQHEGSAKTFSFPIYSDGSKTIPSRSDGMQDGFDLITALALHPECARRLARKFWGFFVSEIVPPDPAFIQAVADVYLRSGTEIKPVVRYIFNSPWFNDPAVRFARYSWPTEFVVRSIKEVGWQNYALDKARSPMAAMGQQLFEPPNVAGWPQGSNWFSTSTMLARTNFAASLASSQKQFLAVSVAREATSPQGLLATMLDRVTPMPFDQAPQQALMSYLSSAGVWTGSGEQLNTRASGLARLLIGSAEYQFV